MKNHDGIRIVDYDESHDPRRRRHCTLQGNKPKKSHQQMKGTSHEHQAHHAWTNQSKWRNHP